MRREPLRAWSPGMAAGALGVGCVVLAAICGDAGALQTFRCGNYLINTGMSAREVLAKCGEPASREVITEPIRAGRGDGTTYQIGVTRTTEHWTYDRGYGKFPAMLEFQEGELKRIELKR